MVNRGNFYAMKDDFYKDEKSEKDTGKPKFKYQYHSPQDKPKTKKKHSKSTLKFTVPSPFEFENREKSKNKPISQIKFEKYINEIKQEEENHLKYHPKAQPVPPEVSIPKYNTMLALQEARRNEIRQNSVKMTKEREKPFGFYIREQNKTKPEKSKDEPFVFKAKPPPASNSIPLYEHMSRKLEEDRKSRIENAAKKALEEAKLPPRMERYGKGDKSIVAQPLSTNFKAKKPPEFAKLWDNLGKSLDKKKQSFQPTQPKEFNFSEVKKKSKTEDDINDELLKKGFAEMIRKKSINLDPPKDLPKPTKKQLENEENGKKRREELKKEEENKKMSEKASKKLEEENNQKKEAKLQKNLEESKKRALEGKEKMKQMDQKYLSDKEKMLENVKNRPNMSEAISSEYSKTNNQQRTLTLIKQKMQARGIPITDIAGESDGFIDIIAEDLV